MRINQVSLLALMTVLAASGSAHAADNSITLEQIGVTTANIDQGGDNNDLFLTQTLISDGRTMTADVTQDGANNTLRLDQQESRVSQDSILSVNQSGSDNNLTFVGNTNNDTASSINQNGSNNEIDVTATPQGGNAGRVTLDQDGRNNSIVGNVNGRNGLSATQTASASNGLILVNGTGLTARQEGDGQTIIAGARDSITFGGASITQHTNATNATAVSFGSGITSNTIEQFGADTFASIRSQHQARNVITQRGDNTSATINNIGTAADRVTILQDEGSDGSFANVTTRGSSVVDVYQDGIDNIAEISTGVQLVSVNSQQLNGNNNLNVNAENSRFSQVNVTQNGGATANITTR